MINKTLKYSLLCMFILFCKSEAEAQKITIEATLDTNSIWIGQQTHLSFEVTQTDENQKVLFPLYSDLVPKGLEILEPTKIDTSRSVDGQLVVKHSYLITSFEDSLFYIKPAPFVTENDTLWSSPLSLKVVQPFEIDTVNNALADIKPIYTPPFDWIGLLNQVLLGLLLLALLVAAYLFIRKQIEKKKKTTPAQKLAVEIERPPHTVALESLKQIENEKAWTKGAEKKTYTELTDTLRIYFSKRYGFNATEMTTSEILSALYFMQKSQKEIYNKLRSILDMADLVKFAKYKALESETEQNLKKAIWCVEQTKEEEEKEIIKKNIDKKEENI